MEDINVAIAKLTVKVDLLLEETHSNSRAIRGTNGDVGLVTTVSKNEQWIGKVDNWVVWAARFLIVQSIAIIGGVIAFLYNLPDVIEFLYTLP